jgi:hypothetical protein
MMQQQQQNASSESASSPFSRVSDHQLPTFKKALEEYDKKYTTLIDYFGILGPPIDQLYNAIDCAKS